MNETKAVFDGRGYQNTIEQYRSRERSREGTAGNPYFENRSPSPSIKVNNQAGHETDFGQYNPITDRREPKPNPLLEPDTNLISVLDEVEDDFRLTIYKLKPDVGGGSYGQQPHAPGASRMVGRATVSEDYAMEAINRVLTPLGLPESNDVANRFFRY